MKAPFWHNLTTRKRKLVLWTVILIALYAVIGFFILPPIIRSVAVKQLSKQLGREVVIEKVKLNPFALSVTIHGLLIKDTDGQPFVSWNEVYVNFQSISFISKAWTFDEVSASSPYVHVRMNQDGTFNFTDILEKFATNSAAAKPSDTASSKPIYLRVNHLNIGRATAALEDFTSREPFKRTVGPLNITLDNFRTDPDNKNPYAFTGTTDAGERISWSGFFYLDPLRSQGSLTLDHLTLNKYAPLYQDFVRFQIRSGSIGVHLNYQFELSPTNRIAEVHNLAFALRDFKLGNPDESNNIIELPHFGVVGAAVDVQNHTARIGSIVGTGGSLSVVRDKSAAVNVIEMAKPAETQANPSEGILLLLRSVTNAVALFINTTNQWTGSLDSMEFTNFSIHLTDLANARPATLNLDDIAFSAKHISNVPGTNAEANISLAWNTNGTIKVGLNAGFFPPTADIDLDLTNLSLGTLDPYLEPKVNLLILGSRLGLDGHVHLQTPKDQLPEITFQGNARLDDFHSIDGVLGEDLLKWDSVRVSGIDANLNPPVVKIQQVAVDNAYARVVIQTNHIINLLAVLRMTNAPGAAETAPVENPKPSEPAPTPAWATNVIGSGVTPQASIASIVISNAQLDFSDYSMSPNVNLGIQQVNGTIDDISSEQLQHANIDIHALVDNVGPVAITGHINPFSGSQTNTIVISVKDVDLTPTSPYSGKFAGYGIARGKLNLDLSYEIVGQKLSSKNVITLDQFTFGDHVDSPDATHLPVRLAVAILKDRDGKIILDVPIEGSLNDPKFRIHKVVTRALLNILEKAATSPFSLLGAMFGGGGEELGYQDFVPGLAVLTDADKQKLDTIVKALDARPGLSVEISGSVDPIADRAGLQHASVEKDIRTRQWQSLSAAERSSTAPDQIVMTPEVHAKWLKKLYGEAQASGKITPALIAANTNLTALAAQIKPHRVEKGATLLISRTLSSGTTTNASGPAGAQTGDPMELLLQSVVPVTDNDFQTLANNRAKAVQAYILQSGKVEAGRLFLTAGQARARMDGARVYLQLR